MAPRVLVGLSRKDSGAINPGFAPSAVRICGLSRQGLNDGDTFVGWGALGRFSEFDSQGNLLFDANVPLGYDTYRAYRFTWEGDPSDEPTATAQQGSGGTIVHAIWNGATQVATWDVLDASGGQGRRSLPGFVGGQKQLAATSWNELDTTITVPGTPTSIIVVAKDHFGHELGRSSVTAVAQ